MVAADDRTDAKSGNQILMTELKLLALDEDDLGVISSHLQDAVMRVGDMRYLPSQKRFVAVLNRFDWEHELAGSGAGGKHLRRQSALRFDRIFGARLKGVRPEQTGTMLSLLAIRFEPEESPGGGVELVFSGDVSIRLTAECIEVELRDLGPAWQTPNKPDHPDSEAGMES